MDTLEQIEAMISTMLKNDMEQLMFRCYILRRVMGWTPARTAVHLKISPNAVSSYAQRAAIIFDLEKPIDPDEEPDMYNRLLNQCVECWRRTNLKKHRDHAVKVVERMNKRLRLTT